MQEQEKPSSLLRAAMQEQEKPSSLSERADPPAGEAAAIAGPGEEQLEEQLPSQKPGKGQLFSGPSEGSCSFGPPCRSRSSRPSS